MDLHEAAAALARAKDFALLTDDAGRNVIVARGEGVHFIAAVAVDQPTGAWLVACLRHGAEGAAKELAGAVTTDGQATDDDGHQAAVGQAKAALQGQQTAG